MAISLFVSRIMQKLLKLIFTKFGGKVSHGPQKQRLDFVANPGHIALGLRSGGVEWYPNTGCVLPSIFLLVTVLPWQRFALY